MVDDVVINKAAIIERCLARVHAEHGGDDRILHENITKQDSIILNLQRACEAAIGLAMHLVALSRLGVPQESREAFDLLVGGAGLDAGLGERLAGMVGFRNVAVHDYRHLDLAIVSSIIRDRLGDLSALTRWAIAQFGDSRKAL
jgi:uncharacterized protein YutE (UPF0331/DUF86 family)